jgi:hypothetical protein
MINRNDKTKYAHYLGCEEAKKKRENGHGVRRTTQGTVLGMTSGGSEGELF